MCARAWRKVPRSLKRQGGWLVHRGGMSRRKIVLTISADTANYNLFTAAGSPADVVDVTVTINAGKYVYASTFPNGAFSTGGGWAAGSTLKLINNGSIIGRGGDGGGGGNGTASASNGRAGQDGTLALSLGYPLTIDNTNGLIGGGGGGAGGGGDHFNLFGPPGGGGGGGGGGRSFTATNSGGAGSAYVTSGSPGSVGGISTGGAGGAGGSGAGFLGGAGGDNTGQDWGAAGTPGNSTASNSGGGGGNGGAAVQTNGFAITWLGGHDATHVKGVEI